MDERAFQACLSDRAAVIAMEARTNAALDRGVRGTPTFFVNGRQLQTGHSLAELDAAIRQAWG